MSEQLFRYSIVGAIVLLFVNIIMLDILSVSKKDEVKPLTESREINTPLVTAVCPQVCTDQIKAATASLQITKKNGKEPTAIPKVSIAQTSVKEFYIPFGTGSSSADDWTDVPGLAANVDSTKYSSINTVVFEATIRIPTGNQTAFARLYNVTGKHPVWNSEVSIEGGTTQLVTSKSVALDNGNNLYQVQMKTSLKYQAFLDQTRLHIILN